MSDGKAVRKGTFIVRKRYRWQIKKLSREQRAELIENMFLYQTEWKFECNDPVVWMLMDVMVDDRKKDSEKYDERCEKNRQTAIERERKKKKEKSKEKPWKDKKHKRAQTCTNVTKSTDYECEYDCDCDYDSWLKEISSNEEIEELSFWDKGINNLINLIKQQCDDLGVAYDKYKDRYFADFILTAKEYWAFCEKIWQGRVEFAVNVLKASVGIGYWKWIASWPMKIYQNYADIYNETLKYKAKNSKNLIQSF